jgi:2',3'-cyclic-nucleotide 2'-phosphodiesterase (5'-nucleotidase family)
MNVHPFGNVIITKKVLGSQILDYLEFVSRATDATYDKNVGENGGFANVSGLKYSIDVTKESTVETDNGNFVRVAGERRVSNVMVLENGVDVELDPTKEYVVASLDFMLSNGGDGANMFMDDELLEYSSKLDFEIVIDYIVNELHGVVSEKYATTEGRITIITE